METAKAKTLREGYHIFLWWYLVSKGWGKSHCLLYLVDLIPVGLEHGSHYGTASQSTAEWFHYRLHQKVGPMEIKILGRLWRRKSSQKWSNELIKEFWGLPLTCIFIHLILISIPKILRTKLTDRVDLRLSTDGIKGENKQHNKGFENN